MASRYGMAGTKGDTHAYVAQSYGIDECVKLLSGMQDLPAQEHNSGDSAIEGTCPLKEEES